MKFKLKVSRRDYNHFKTTSDKFSSAYDPGQLQLTRFFDEVTRDQLRINSLLEANKQLKESLKAAEASDLLDSHFLSNMVALSKVNQNSSRFRYVYSDFMKDVALHIFCSAGRTAYETLYRNLPGVFPRLRSTQYRLAEQDRPNEGEFPFEKIKAKMLQNDEILEVNVADDDTKLEEAMRYDSRTNTVIGL